MTTTTPIRHPQFAAAAAAWVAECRRLGHDMTDDQAASWQAWAEQELARQWAAQQVVAYVAPALNRTLSAVDRILNDACRHVARVATNAR